MEFDFLPNLPKSNLDDRAYKDVMEECLLRIPRYCPEWTNHNPSDPGTTLIEMFAWLTDQMQLRFNQVPRRNYVTFLELLGIRLDPPQPARTELTFYLTSAQEFPIIIPQDTEVATERTAAEEAIVFSTDTSLIIGNPRIRHFLTSTLATESPGQNSLENPFINTIYERNQDWRTIEQTELFTEYQVGNCFYLVLDTLPTLEAQSLEGNVLEITFRGEPATGTGINPDEPPRLWQAWNGEEWQPILRQERDDRTKGFNFSGTAPGQQRVREASVVLHLPQQLPMTQFETDYYGYWIRCVYQPTREEQQEQQSRYSTPPRVLGFSVRSLGGAISASQCIRVEEEFLGVSTGKPGQTFQLQMQPVLERRTGENIEVRIPGEPAQTWEEVSHFSSSGAESYHYTIDSRQGVVQFGPLIREPGRLQQQTHDRAQIQMPFQSSIRRLRQQNGTTTTRPLTEENSEPLSFAERQYGKIPPPGAEVYMLSYRFGGGTRGNVEPEKLVILRSSLPYISQVTNYAAAIKGAEAESLQDAVMRVPPLLRTRECAVTPEDFEATAKRLPGQRIARAHCLTESEHTTPGVVRLLLVPQVNPHLNTNQGMHPDRVLRLGQELRSDLAEHFRNRRPLGIYVKFEEPEYVGVSVRVNVLLDSKYNNANARSEIATEIQTRLYQFLNPLTGGIEGTGWELERPIYISDIISLCQKVRGVRHLGQVQLYEVRRQDGMWTLYEAPDSTVDPGPFGLICSWSGGELRSFCRDKQTSAHEVLFIE